MGFSVVWVSFLSVLSAVHLSQSQQAVAYENNTVIPLVVFVLSPTFLSLRLAKPDFLF